jgi:hypothetical protein
LFSADISACCCKRRFVPGDAMDREAKHTLTHKVTNTAGWEVKVTNTHLQTKSQHRATHLQTKSKVTNKVTLTNNVTTKVGSSCVSQTSRLLARALPIGVVQLRGGGNAHSGIGRARPKRLTVSSGSEEAGACADWWAGGSCVYA